MTIIIIIIQNMRNQLHIMNSRDGDTCEAISIILKLRQSQIAAIDGVCCADFYLCLPQPEKLFMLQWKSKEKQDFTFKSSIPFMWRNNDAACIFIHRKIMNWENENFIAWKFFLIRSIWFIDIHTHYYMHTHTQMHTNLHRKTTPITTTEANQ